MTDEPNFDFRYGGHDYTETVEPQRVAFQVYDIGQHPVTKTLASVTWGDDGKVRVFPDSPAEFGAAVEAFVESIRREARGESLE